MSSKTLPPLPPSTTPILRETLLQLLAILSPAVSLTAWRLHRGPPRGALGFPMS